MSEPESAGSADLAPCLEAVLHGELSLELQSQFKETNQGKETNVWTPAHLASRRCMNAQ